MVGALICFPPKVTGEVPFLPHLLPLPVPLFEDGNDDLDRNSVVCALLDKVVLLDE